MTGIVHVAATNIQGMGALRLVQSLLPALAEVAGPRLGYIFLPNAGPLPELATELGLSVRRIKRRLPNAVSRVAECLYSTTVYPNHCNMLVLGDVPLALSGKQVVLVHRAHMINGDDTGSTLGNAKVAVSRALFRRNAAHVHRAIVQSETVARQLAENFPEVADRIAIIPQPAPNWLSITPRVPHRPGSPLRLFYPASPYPHKNHDLLFRYAESVGSPAPVEIMLTLDDGPRLPRFAAINRVGLLDTAAMCDRYAECDALLFPSLEESYGLPLIEAMTAGIPIIAADRPYARSLCGDRAIYFDPIAIDSLRDAIEELRRRLETGWSADYADRLAPLPSNWSEVAQRMLALFDLD